MIFLISFCWKKTDFRNTNTGEEFEKLLKHFQLEVIFRNGPLRLMETYISVKIKKPLTSSFLLVSFI